MTDFCKGKPLGVEAATQLLIEMCERKFDRTLSPYEAREIMHAYASNGRKEIPNISVYGRSIGTANLGRLADEAVIHIGSEIVSFVFQHGDKMTGEPLLPALNPFFVLVVVSTTSTVP